MEVGKSNPLASVFAGFCLETDVLQSITRNWLRELDSIKHCQIQNLESYRLNDLAVALAPGVEPVVLMSSAGL